MRSEFGTEITLIQNEMLFFLKYLSATHAVGSLGWNSQLDRVNKELKSTCVTSIKQEDWRMLQQAQAQTQSAIQWK